MYDEFIKISLNESDPKRKQLCLDAARKLKIQNPEVFNPPMEKTFWQKIKEVFR
jgi:hypothetical protein